MNIKDIKVNNKITLFLKSNSIARYFGVITSIDDSTVDIHWSIFHGNKVTQRNNYRIEEVLSWGQPDSFYNVKISYCDVGMICKKIK